MSINDVINMNMSCGYESREALMMSCMLLYIFIFYQYYSILLQLWHCNGIINYHRGIVVLL